MKKAFFAVFIIVTLLFSSADFTPQKIDDYRLYSDAYTNMSELKCADIDGRLEIVSRQGNGEPDDNGFTADFAVKFDNTDNNNPKLLFEYTYSTFQMKNTERTVSVYIENESAYIAVTAQTYTGDKEIYKFKQTTENYSDGFKFPSDIDIFTEADFDSIGIDKEQTENGCKYTITKTAEQVKEIINKLAVIGDENKDFAEELKKYTEKISLGDIVISFVIKDGYFIEVKAEVRDDTINDSQNLFPAKAEINIDINNPGEKVEVKSPYQLSEYNDFVPGKLDYILYSVACKNTSELKCIDVSGNANILMTINFDATDIPLSIPIDFRIRINTLDENNPKILIEYSTSSEFTGTETTVSAYIADGYIYTSNELKSGELNTVSKVKVKMQNMSELSDLKNIFKLNTHLFSEADFYNTEKESVTDGYRYTITKNGLELKNIIRDIASNTFDAMDSSDYNKPQSAEDLEKLLDEINFGDALIKFTIENGYFTQAEVQLNNTEVSDVESKISLKIEFNTELNLNNPGDDVEIDAPYDLDEYKENDEVTEEPDTSEE